MICPMCGEEHEQEAWEAAKKVADMCKNAAEIHMTVAHFIQDSIHELPKGADKEFELQVIWAGLEMYALALDMKQGPKPRSVH